MIRAARIREPADSPQPLAGEDRDPVDPAPVGWVTVVAATAGAPTGAERAVNMRRLVLQLCAAAVAVGVLVALIGAALSRRIAERQSVHDVAQQTDILAESVVQPALTDRMAGDPRAAAALGTVIRAPSLVRVKLWSPQGTILYSDEPRLVARTFPLDESARAALTAPQTTAEISDLSRPENAFERSRGKLLEVYRPVWTPDGHPLLFEAYYPYGVVTEGSSQLWRGFLGVTLSSVAAVFALLVPIVAALLRRTRRAQAQREDMMRRALDASHEERHRIAAALHDGPVQQLAAASFSVSGAAEAAATRGEHALSDDLHAAAATVRTGMTGLRSLVVDIYPPSLRSAGLAAALRDMVTAVAGASVTVDVQVDDAAVARLDADQQQAVFRFAQEALRNTVEHAAATTATLTVATVPGGSVAVELGDNGRGFRADDRPDKHLGITLMCDIAANIGARLDLRTSPGNGTVWRMEVPTR
jgi:two-component system NarL family sensor kinase